MKPRFLLPTISAAAFFLLANSYASGQDSPAPSKPSRNVRPAREWKRFSYTCEGGAKLTVYLHNQSAKLRFQDATHFMTQTEAASGTRYSDGKLIWWSKGDIGFLQTDTPAGDGQMLLKDCHLDKPANPAATKP